MKRETFLKLDAKTGRSIGTVRVLTPEGPEDIARLNAMLASGEIKPPKDRKDPRSVN